MFRSLAGSLVFVVAAGALAADESDLKALEGTYTVTLMEHEGKAAEKELLQKTKFAIKGDTLTITFGGDEKKAKIKLDAAKTPHHIDISPSEGPEKGKTFPGIYKMDKGELTLAFTEKSVRPKEFKADDNVVLVKLKKE